MKAIIAETYERIHRSNLVGMGIVPLQYLEGETAESLELNGREEYSISLPQNITPGQLVDVKVCVLCVTVLCVVPCVCGDCVRVCEIMCGTVWDCV